MKNFISSELLTKGDYIIHDFLEFLRNLRGNYLSYHIISYIFPHITFIEKFKGKLLIISYHIISYIFPHITFIYYKNIQIYCINIFLILNNKIRIGFWNKEGLAESHYGFTTKPLFVSRVLRTHGWNILKVCNFIS